MSELGDNGSGDNGSGENELTVRRTIAATPQRLFEAWTNAHQLQAWFGPPGGHCTGASIDPRPGGRYRIDNATGDGSIVAIVGEFLVVDPPNALVYTWRIEPAGSGSSTGSSNSSSGSAPTETVTVTFKAAGNATEVTVVHRGILDSSTRAGHEGGWIACLDNLADYL